MTGTAGPVGTVTQPAKPTTTASATTSERLLIPCSLELASLSGRVRHVLRHDLHPSLRAVLHVRVVPRRVSAVVPVVRRILRRRGLSRNERPRRVVVAVRRI